jgi:hypothetical protein
MCLKRTVVETIGAVAMLAMTVPALSQETTCPPTGCNVDETYQVSTIYGLLNSGIGNPNFVGTFFSFDISWVDNVQNKYYLADRSNLTIDIINLSTGALTQVQNFGFTGFTGNNDTSGPDGLATVNNHTELWVGDATRGTGVGRLWVLNASDASVKNIGVANPIIIGGTTRADEFCYDHVDNIIMIASPAEDPPFVTFVSATTYTKLGTLVFDGTAAPKATNGLEQCGYSDPALGGTGLFYQNIPEVGGNGNDTSPGAIAVIVPTAMAFVGAIPIPLEQCAGPQGLAIGLGGVQIMEGCNAAGPNGHRNTVLVTLTSPFTGQVTGFFADAGGADEVWFAPGGGLGGHFIWPYCNTACRTPPAPFALTFDEALAVVDATGSRTLVDQTVFVAQPYTPFFTPVVAGNPRTVHSVAAGGPNNVIILPIPAAGGAVTPVFAPTLCDKRPQNDVNGGVNITVLNSPGTGIAPSFGTGCIVVLQSVGTPD